MLTGDELPEVLATVEGGSITMEDVDARVGHDLERMEMQYRIARRELIETALETLVRERVLFGEARAQGRTVEDLVLDEAGPGLQPTDAEIEEWYQENQARLGRRSLDQARSQIADHLREERRNEAMARLEDRLFEERGVEVFLEPMRIEFDNSRAPFIGSADAPVTLVEFSDFQCPYCAGLAPTLKQLEREFQGQLRVVYRHFPLTSIHPHAAKAAEASMCAADQGQFWMMHDLIFEEQDRVAVADLKEKARRLGLDSREFEACLDSGRHAEIVQSDFEEGQKAGVNGTPAMFVNGVRVQGGAVSFETAAAAIREELTRLERRGGRAEVRSAAEVGS